ncbi:asparagine synthase (glutamine-hydrolyzing) [Moorena bouillonii]|uniref:asparagine synthase (glutamine-hydrolyzing) n=1 Tax=Moorena bouillonii PNG TaxID=568701 RepID=A0A1U7N460_9CYAN|nr:asparagine synthase (glutamine-hydrolyzing) [Moorena bouillonii]OLT60748.1 asparagine synthase (glutamine-hydrolyzing) [Moorena bouillonii PNG]
MGSIVGIFTATDKHLTRNLLLRMGNAITYSGSDDSYLDITPEDGVALAHVPLIRRDLSADSYQPMWNSNHTSVVVFSGNIFNCLEIREELETLGFHVQSNSDTEVLLKGYEAWGTEVVHKLNGTFAFAIWDRSVGRLWLARDRFGEQPLYYFFDELHSTFIFASELKAILEHPVVSKAVDPQGLQSYLVFGYVPSPLSLVKGVKKLQPAHSLIIEAGKTPQLHHYWQLQQVATLQSTPEAEIRDNLRSRFELAVKRRLDRNSDFSPAALLSGGLDSTLVVGMMSKLSKEPVHTFSTAFEIGSLDAEIWNTNPNQCNSDADVAKAVSAHFGTKHSQLIISGRQDLIGTLRRCVRSFGEPHSNQINVTMLLLAEWLKEQGIAVVMTGDGSDAIFGGEPRHQLDMQISLLQKLPSWLRNLAYANRNKWPVKDNFNPTAFRRVDLAPLTVERLSTWFTYGKGEFNQLLQGEYATDTGVIDSIYQELLKSLLSKNHINSNQDALLYMDLKLDIKESNRMRAYKTSTPAGLESLTPFLDYQFVEYAMSIPFARKVGWQKDKQLLRATFSDLLPKVVQKRKKYGWRSPFGSWLKDYLWEDVGALIKTLPETGIFKPEVCNLIKDYQPGNSRQIWSLLTFAIWHQEVME